MLRRLLWVLWPAFLMAGAGEVLLFAFVDPRDVTFHGVPLDVSREAVYTITFFLLWALMAASGAMTLFLAAERRQDV